MGNSLAGIEDFRVEYLANLDEELNSVEGSLLKLEGLKGHEYTDALYNIFRKVHSFKGSAGSFELFMLGTIFHRFEDYLNNLLQVEFQSVMVDNSLKYLDILRSCIGEYRGNTPQVEKYTTILEGIGFEQKENYGKLLLVDATHSMAKIFQRISEENNLELIIVSNGLTALNRVLHERFDFIVSSKNVESLDGESVLRAIRVMNCLNQKTPLVLISSDEKDKERSEEYHFVPKDEKIIENTNAYLEKVIANIPTEEEGSGFPYKKVLIAEDDEMIQKILVRIFANLKDTELVITSDFKTSYNALVTEKPDLIILDYFFRDCVGSQIIEQYFRKHGRLETPILFMTSSSERINMEEVLGYGNVKGIIDKPIKVRLLLDEILRVASS